MGCRRRQRVPTGAPQEMKGVKGPILVPAPQGPVLVFPPGSNTASSMQSHPVPSAWGAQTQREGQPLL